MTVTIANKLTFQGVFIVSITASVRRFSQAYLFHFKYCNKLSTFSPKHGLKRVNIDTQSAKSVFMI